MRRFVFIKPPHFQFFIVTSPHKSEKYKISDNNSHPLPTESDDPATACGIPPDGAVYGRSVPPDGVSL